MSMAQDAAAGAATASESPDPDLLYRLVPAFYRSRDAAQGYTLRALLRVIGEQADVVERDIAGLYENWFIETCADWVVPYIGALVGWTPVASGTSGSDARGVARQRIMVPRREVANTVRFRRRKGTLALLEDLADAVAGWPAHAVEFFRLLMVTQNISHLRMDRGRTAELRDGDALYALDGAFDEMARSVDIRRANSTRTRGAANISSVGVFIWRLRAYSVTKSPAYCFEEVSANCFLFSPLGNDTRLFVDPLRAMAGAGADLALPRSITRRDFERREIDEATGAEGVGVPFYYGPERSLCLWTGDGADMAPVPAEKIVPADLSDWAYRPMPGTYAVDPHMGRILVPAGQAARRPALWVSYTYGFSADIGGGEYRRALDQPPEALIFRVGRGTKLTRLNDALAAWREQAPASAVIEIVDSNVYAEPVTIELAEGQTLVLRAASGTRPVLRMLDWQTSAPDDLTVTGVAGGWFVLDGLLVTGRGLRIGGGLSGVTIRDSTLVPGWGLECECGPRRPAESSIDVVGAPLCLAIERSIVGGIQVERDEAAQDPLILRVRDSIVDATDPGRVAIGATGKLCAFVAATLERCTVIGQVQAHSIDLAADSILLGLVRVCRRQRGCLRFCYVAPGSRTPRRYECQPDLVERPIVQAFVDGEIEADARDALLRAERLRVEPEFNETRYGRPEYCQLAAACASEIVTGAEDRSELGAFHDLYQPQRSANLRQRLAEFTPAGADAGIIFAS